MTAQNNNSQNNEISKFVMPLSVEEAKFQEHEIVDKDAKKSNIFETVNIGHVASNTKLLENVIEEFNLKELRVGIGGLTRSVSHKESVNIHKNKEPVLQPYLELSDGSKRLLEFSSHDEMYHIGRDGGNCELVIEDPRVSRMHCAITTRDGQYYIEDLMSSNGTFVKGVRLVEPCRLSGGEIIEFGQASVVFNLGSLLQ